jgi:peroxiredoxin
MPALKTGKIAPDVELPGVGGAKISLKEALRGGPVVLAFFKISCPVCQYAFPYLERLYRNYPGAAVRFIGVSQNSEQDTRTFMREFGITFPIALDPEGKYPVSNAYGITNVPTVFYIAPDGEVQVSSVGWIRDDMQKINELIAGNIGNGIPPLFKPGEQVADFRAG